MALQTCQRCRGDSPDYRVLCDWCRFKFGDPLTEDEVRMTIHPIGEILWSDRGGGTMIVKGLQNQADWPEHENWRPVA